MDEKLFKKLGDILALRNNAGTEGEAMAAAEMLTKLLEKHNLDIADLERRGQQNAPAVQKKGHDLAKAAFTWKLDLAEAIAEHYFCYPMVDRHAKTVAFVGRPDNVEALEMMYGWLISQIKQIATAKRREQATHIDPLRWQVNFGVGAVERLRDRLHEIAVARRTQTDSSTMALVIHHETEISDYLEETYGYRRDGRPTKAQMEREAEYDRKRCAQIFLREFNNDKFLELYPTAKPKTAEELREEAERLARWAHKDAVYAARSAGSRKAAATRAARKGYNYAEEEKYRQSADARRTGRIAADEVNLSPFLKEGQKVESIG